MTEPQSSAFSFVLVETKLKILIHTTTNNISNGPEDDRNKLEEALDVMIIERSTEEITFTRSNFLAPLLYSENQAVDPGDRVLIRSIPIAGILGVINLIGGAHLLVVKSKEYVGLIGGHAIWRVGECEVIPFKATTSHLTAAQIKADKVYVKMLSSVLSTPAFYFSKTYDLTMKLQSSDSNPKPPGFYGTFRFQPCVGCPEEEAARQSQGKFFRYVWNHNHLFNLMDIVRRSLQQGGPPDENNYGGIVEQVQSFCFPIIHGFVSINAMEMGSHRFKFSLISRRSWERVGARFHSRGIDPNGNVSNFVETEQLVEHKGVMTSFVQIRGSMPFYWSQRPNLRWLPEPVISSTADHEEAYARHYHGLLEKYNKIVSINLINYTGPDEGPLYEKCMELSRSAGAKLAKTRYQPFPFNDVSSYNPAGRLRMFMALQRDEIKQFGFYKCSRLKGLQLQTGVFRTNCIECLDRTNVIQAMIAKMSLSNVLMDLRILKLWEDVEKFPEVDQLFRGVWVENGNMLSTQYAGTPALKTELTWKGYRTYRGDIRDGGIWILRYVRGNFKDGFRQDALDLFAGNYRVESEEGRGGLACPLEKRTWKRYAALALPVLLATTLMTVVRIVGMGGFSPENVVCLMFLCLVIYVLGEYMVDFGNEFVDNPVLS